MTKMKIILLPSVRYAAAATVSLVIIALLSNSAYGQVIDPNAGFSSNQNLQGTSAGLQQQQSGLQGSTPSALETTDTDQVLNQSVPTLRAPSGLPIQTESSIPAAPQKADTGSEFPTGIVVTTLIVIGFLAWRVVASIKDEDEE